MHSHHSARKHFPSGIEVFSHSWKCTLPKSHPRLVAGVFGWGWGTFILPYIEQNVVYDQIKFYNVPGADIIRPLSNFQAGAAKVDDISLPFGSQGMGADWLLRFDDQRRQPGRGLGKDQYGGRGR